MLKKALETNGCNFPELAEPKWNIHTLEKNISLLEKEIEELRHGAFATKFETNGAKMLNVTCPTSGLDYDLLQAKLGRLDSMKVRLKSLELLNNV